MAITFSLSTKVDNKGLSEILIRYKSGIYSARAKSGIYSDPNWFDYVKGDNSKTPLKGKKVVTSLMQDMQTYHSEQKIKLLEINTLISDTLKDKSTDRTNSKWLLGCIDRYYQRGEYTPKEPEVSSFFQLVTHFVDTAHTRTADGRLLSKASILQYKSTQKNLKEFAKKLGRKDFKFSDIDLLFYEKFVEYLQSEVSVKEKGEPVIIKKAYAKNTVGKNIKILKSVLYYGQANGICYIPALAGKKLKTLWEDVDSVYLNETELQKLKNKDFSETPYLERVRDCFLLLAWTGCRFSDLSKITKTDIKDGFITFRQQKTNNKVTIPLHPVVVEILEKYSYNLPTEMSNQKINEYIKVACQMAGLDCVETITRTVGGKLVTETLEKHQLVSSHTGRRSFCTNMYKRGLPTLMIMSVSGHTTEKSFLKYIKVKQEEHAGLMAKKWAEMYKK
ncbi:MAG: site-specific integrase [Bacteroidales bacterium]|nr:site-specific integrase [Bacteroidales bacterium]